MWFYHLVHVRTLYYTNLGGPAAGEFEARFGQGEQRRGEVGPGEPEGDDAPLEELPDGAGRHEAEAQVHAAPEHVVHHEAPEAPGDRFEHIF